MIIGSALLCIFAICFVMQRICRHVATCLGQSGVACPKVSMKKGTRQHFVFMLLFVKFPTCHWHVQQDMFINASTCQVHVQQDMHINAPRCHVHVQVVQLPT